MSFVYAMSAWIYISVCIKEWWARNMNIERTFIWPRQMTTILSFSCHDKKSTANVGELFVIWRKYIFFMPEEMPWKGKHSPFVYLSSIKIFITVCLNCERSVALRGKVYAKIYFRLAWNALQGLLSNSGLQLRDHSQRHWCMILGRTTSTQLFWGGDLLPVCRLRGEFAAFMNI